MTAGSKSAMKCQKKLELQNWNLFDFLEINWFILFYEGSLERRDKRSSWAASSTASLASTATLIAANEAGGQGNFYDK